MVFLSEDKNGKEKKEKKKKEKEVE